MKKIKKTILLFSFLFLLPSYSVPVSVNKRSIFSDARNKINYYRILNNRAIWNKREHLTRIINLPSEKIDTSYSEDSFGISFFSKPKLKIF